jgi:hypothetical protein
VLAGRSGGKLRSSLPLSERADESACLDAVEHDRRGLTVPEGAEANERGGSGRADVRAVLVGVEDERRTELRGERGKEASRLRALLESARVVAEEEIDLAAAGEPLEGSPLECDGPVPVATGSTRSHWKRTAVRETAQATKPEACSRRQVVQAEAERHRTGRGSSSVRAGERLGIVVIPVNEQKL